MLLELQTLASAADIRIRERNAKRAEECAQARTSNMFQQPPLPTVPPRPNFTTRQTPVTCANLPTRLIPLCPTFTPCPSFAPRDGSIPMEIDSQGRRHLTREENERRRKAGVCTYCSQPGHTNWRCPTAPPAAWKIAAIEVQDDTEEKETAGE
jgi:hypothetical protein